MLPFKVLCTETGQVWLYPVDQDMYGWRFRLLFGFGTVESSNVLFSNSECTVYTVHCTVLKIWKLMCLIVHKTLITLEDLLFCSFSTTIHVRVS